MEGLTVTILGSGTCVPSIKRSSCSVLIETATAKLLFDIGPGTMRRLLDVGVTIGEISHLFVSHLHPDHTGELVPFLFASKYPEKLRRRGRLRITAAEGFQSFYRRLEAVYGRWIELEEGIVDILEMSCERPDYMQFGYADIHTLPLAHIASSIGYRINAPDGTSVVYTGDTDYCKNVVQLAMNADLLICECAFPDDLKTDGHVTPSLAGRIASEARVKTLLLTHFYPECDGVDVAAQCRKTYSGTLLCAEDLMRIEFAGRTFTIVDGEGGTRRSRSRADRST